MSWKGKLLVWAMVFVIMLTSVTWASCGTAEPDTTLAPSESPQQPRGEGFIPGGQGFMPGATGVLTILAATDDELIDTALREAVDEGRITKEQADQVRGWWQQRPKILSPDVFPRQMRAR